MDYLLVVEKSHFPATGFKIPARDGFENKRGGQFRILSGEGRVYAMLIFCGFIVNGMPILSEFT